MPSALLSIGRHRVAPQNLPDSERKEIKSQERVSRLGLKVLAISGSSVPRLVGTRTHSVSRLKILLVGHLVPKLFRREASTFRQGSLHHQGW